MKAESPTVLARRYVKDMLAIMQRYGGRPCLGRARYWRLVRDCRRPVEQARKRQQQNMGEQKPCANKS